MAHRALDPNPYAPPAAPIVPGSPPGTPGGDFVVEGDQATVPLARPLPDVCVKCGKTGDLTVRQQSFRWAPPWTNALLLVGVIPAVVVQAVLTKRARLSLPICSPCDARWTKAVLIARVVLLGPIGVTILAMILAVATDWGGIVAAVAFLLMVPTLIIVPALVYFLVVKPRSLRTTRIDARTIKLLGLSPASLDAMRRAGNDVSAVRSL